MCQAMLLQGKERGTENHDEAIVEFLKLTKVSPRVRGYCRRLGPRSEEEVSAGGNVYSLRSSGQRELPVEWGV